jgi:hypothetical protein
MAVAARAWVSVMLPEPIKPMWVVMRRAFYAEFARPAALHESVKLISSAGILECLFFELTPARRNVR